MNIELLKNMLTEEEGKRPRMYKDSLGIETIGIGHNLRDKPISDKAISVIFEDDLNDTFKDLDLFLSWWRQLDDVRQVVIADMAFNLGITKLLGFKNTLSMLKDGKYIEAADNGRKSLWYKQVGTRGEKLMKMLETGEIVK